MKYVLLALFGIALLGSSAQARDVYVKPHVTKDGTYVEGHHRTSPNETKMDNYSTEGNYNPYTGEVGKRNPYAVEPYTPDQRRH